MRRIFLALCLALCAPAALADNVGKQLQTFDLPWKNSQPAGQTYHSADHKNAVYVLESYANYCGYCNENAPNVDALADHYKDNPRVQVIDAGTDYSDREYTRWINEHNPNHPVLEAQRTFVDQLEITGIPHVTVLDGQLKVVYDNEGVWDDQMTQEIEAAVDQALRICDDNGCDVANLDPNPVPVPAPVHFWECEARPLIGVPIYLSDACNTESEARVSAVHHCQDDGHLGCYVTKCTENHL